MGMDDLINDLNFGELRQERRTKEKRRSDREMARFVERHERKAKRNKIILESDMLLQALEQNAFYEEKQETFRQAARAERIERLVVYGGAFGTALLVLLLVLVVLLS